MLPEPSRLDIVIGRLTAQREFLEAVAAAIADVPGPVLELGLGNGRTYDHLRRLLPDRRIVAFDRAITAHPASIPPADTMIVGEIRDTLAFCGDRVGGLAAFVHADLGTGDPTADRAKAAWLGPLIDARLAPGGFVATGIALPAMGWHAEPRSAAAETGRYWLYRKM